MPRRTQRLIATLLVWIAILFTAGTVVSRIASPPVNSWNAWYTYGNIVAEGDPEQANQLLTDIQQLANDVYQQSQAIAMGLYGQYALWLLVILAILLVGGVVATFFIWRSVALPVMAAEAGNVLPAGKRRLLEDDGENDLMDDPLPAHQGRAR
jgi:hypothetical protein